MLPEAHYKDGTELVIGLMRQAFKDQFHAIFEGDPYQIPESLLPCIVVSKQSGTSQPSATGTQEITENILIQIIVNKKDDFGADLSTPDVQLTNRRLRVLAEGRNPSDGTYLPNSVCGVLAQNLTIGGNVLEMKLSTSYALTLRTDQMLTQEAHVSVFIRERIIVLGRN